MSDIFFRSKNNNPRRYLSQRHGTEQWFSLHLTRIVPTKTFGCWTKPCPRFLLMIILIINLNLIWQGIKFCINIIVTWMIFYTMPTGISWLFTCHFCLHDTNQIQNISAAPAMTNPYIGNEISALFRKCCWPFLLLDFCSCSNVFHLSINIFGCALIIEMPWGGG